MFEGLTLQQLRMQMEEHLLMVEEVLGGMDLYVEEVEQRVSRIEKVLGVEKEGIATAGALADLQRITQRLSQIFESRS